MNAVFGRDASLIYFSSDEVYVGLHDQTTMGENWEQYKARVITNAHKLFPLGFVEDDEPHRYGSPVAHVYAFLENPLKPLPLDFPTEPSVNREQLATGADKG